MLIHPCTRVFLVILMFIQAQMDHGSIQFSLLYQALYDRITVVVRKAMRLTADSTTYTSTLGKAMLLDGPYNNRCAVK